MSKTVKMRAEKTAIQAMGWSLLSLVALSNAALAEFDWFTVTFENDVFIDSDNGYTNGVFFSLFDTSEGEETRSPDFLARALQWSLPDAAPIATVNSYTLGQTMSTPTDIKVANPPPGELPYAGLLVLNNSFLSIHEDYADRISTSLGVVGPLSGAEPTQKFIHKLIDSPEPKGWDTQLENELVFQLSRARVWRYWASGDDRFDLLLDAEASVGTISSSLNAGATLRYGRNLSSSYATTLYNSSRSTNISATDSDWNVYLGLRPGFTANQIFTDGNTFRDSRSIDYDRGRLGLIAGFAYSIGDYSLSFSFNDLNLIEGDKELLREFDRYGSITVAFRL